MAERWEARPLVIPTKSDGVYNVLRREILTCRLGPGSLINQAELAERLHVSTTPVREGLRRLAAEGLVVLGAYKDAFVSPLSAKEARELFEVRLVLDPLAAAGAATRADSEVIYALETLLGELEPIAEGVSEAGLGKHRDLHRLIYRASQNDVLANMLDDLWDKTDRYRHYELGLLTIGTKRYDDFRAHYEIVQAIRDRDEARAGELSRVHVERSLARLALERLAADKL